MKKYIENGNTIIEANGAGFIIPNHAGHGTNFSKSFYDQEFMPIVKMNGIDFNDETDWIVQVWAVSEDLHSNNLTCHGFKIVEDGTKTYYSPRMELLPSNIFAGKKEGDQVSFDVPIFKEDEEGDLTDEIDVILRFHMTLSQKEYRYASFGRFEEVLQRVCH